VDFVLLSNAEVDICHEAFLDTNIGATQLDNNAMKDVIGGETVGRLVCDRNTGVAIYVPNCDRSTLEPLCGGDLSNAYCTEMNVPEQVVLE
jgi:hypothetical protein